MKIFSTLINGNGKYRLATMASILTLAVYTIFLVGDLSSGAGVSPQGGNNMLPELVSVRLMA